MIRRTSLVDPAHRRSGPPAIRWGAAGTCLLLVLWPSEGRGQAGAEWITETSLAYSHYGQADTEPSFMAGAVLLADLGLRWPLPPQRSLGVSLAGGYDFRNLDVLGGVRGRLAVEWERSRLEGSLGIFGSSILHGSAGAVLAVAYYPVPWLAVAGQVDLMPTLEDVPGEPPPDGIPEQQVGHRAAASLGLRLADEVGRGSWIAAGAVAILAGVGASAGRR